MFSSIYYIFISFIFFLYTFTNLNIGQIYLTTIKNNQPVFLKPKMVGQNFSDNLTAKSVLIVDQKTRTNLWEKDPGSPRSIASLTKLMTTLVFLKSSPDWQKIIEIKFIDFQHGSSRYLKLGEQLSVKDLFYLGLIGSDNVAISALVRSVGFSEEDYVKLMNQQARLLGMTKTYFSEPTGVSAENISTANDLSQLIYQAFSREEIRQATNLNNYQISINQGKIKREVINTNKLLVDNNFKIFAGKTGSLEAAGYCLVNQLADITNQQIMIIILGSESEDKRFTETKTLANWIFENFIFY